MEPQSSLGDRAALLAGVLAIVLVGLFGAEPDETASRSVPAPAGVVAQCLKPAAGDAGRYTAGDPAGALPSA
jgi:hypothetical protein